MTTIDLNVNSANENAASLKSALETHASSYFSGVSVTDNVVTCIVNGSPWLTITVADSGNAVTYECVGNTVNTFFKLSTTGYWAVSHLFVFDTAIILHPRSNTWDNVYEQGVILTKDKSGLPVLIAANVTISDNIVSLHSSSINQSGQKGFAAAAAFKDAVFYNVYRTYDTEGTVFGVPITNGDSFTENVLQSVMSSFTDQRGVHQIFVNGVSYYSWIYDSIYIKST